MFDIKPIMKRDPTKPGVRIEDYLEAWKSSPVMKDGANEFLSHVLKYKRDEIPGKSSNWWCFACTIIIYTT
jgi:hypothetical protein